MQWTIAIGVWLGCVALLAVVPATYGGKLYKSSCKFSWAQANLFCQYSGRGKLFSPSDKHRFNEGVKACGASTCWLGIHRATKKSVLFTTIYFDTYYLKWDCGQPDNWKGSEACVALKDTGMASDLSCNGLHHALCDFNHLST